MVCLLLINININGKVVWSIYTNKMLHLGKKLTAGYLSKKIYISKFPNKVQYFFCCKNLNAIEDMVILTMNPKINKVVSKNVPIASTILQN